MILVLNLAEDRFQNIAGDTSHEVLLRVAHEIHENTIDLRTARKKGFIERTMKKFMDYYPTSLLALVPFVLTIMSLVVSTVPEKAKKH